MISCHIFSRHLTFFGLQPYAAGQQLAVYIQEVRKMNKCTTTSARKQKQQWLFHTANILTYRDRRVLLIITLICPSVAGCVTHIVLCEGEIPHVLPSCCCQTLESTTRTFTCLFAILSTCLAFSSDASYFYCPRPFTAAGLHISPKYDCYRIGKFHII